MTARRSAQAAGAEICSQRTSGGLPTQIHEIASSKLRARACMVKDASVVHPRRTDWSHALSSELNMMCVLRYGPVSYTDTCGERFDPVQEEKRPWR